jgi:hypothetical protein
VTHKLSTITRTQLFSHLPWWACAAWWALTMLGMLYVTPIMLVAVVNPLWFRESMLTWTMSHAESVVRWRAHVLKPVIDKYLLFETLKA